MAEMVAPESGVMVRMYRQGHGDCFLLAFRDDKGSPFYMLIDCGFKPKSKVHHGFSDIVKDIRRATGGRIHAVLVTHEHQDHVNGFWKSSSPWFKDIDIDHLWLAWTEDPNDEFANLLRERFDDTLLGLVAAEHLLGARARSSKGGSLPWLSALRERVRETLAFELGDEPASPRRWSRKTALAAIAGSTNKKAIRYLRDKAQKGIVYLTPERREPYFLPRVRGVKIYALGPPRNEELLLSLDPRGPEEYSTRFGLSRESRSFYLAATSRCENDADSSDAPFAPRFGIRENEIAESEHRAFFKKRYLASDERWRKIDDDWLQTAERLALRLNSEVNNTSLVTAIELPNTKRVLLFTCDAQRGSWISWDDQDWNGPEGTVTARDLLGRTVLYKVGHHGSHNATLKGHAGSSYPNLQWMARDDHKDDFVAMIPANREWAYGKSRPWKHPLRSIESALKRKAKGRVFRTDVDDVRRSSALTDAEWNDFRARSRSTSLFFEYWIPDPPKTPPDADHDPPEDAEPEPDA